MSIEHIKKGCLSTEEFDNKLCDLLIYNKIKMTALMMELGEEMETAQEFIDHMIGQLLVRKTIRIKEKARG